MTQGRAAGGILRNQGVWVTRVFRAKWEEKEPGGSKLSPMPMLFDLIDFAENLPKIDDHRRNKLVAKKWHRPF